MPNLLNPFRLAAPGGGSAAVLRSTSSASQTAEVGTITVPLPAGTVAGDLLVITSSSNQGGGITTPSGWTELEKPSGSFITGWSGYGIATSTDVTNGSLTLTCPQGSGAELVQVICYCFSTHNGTASVLYSSRSSTGATTTSSTFNVAAGSVAVYAAHCRYSSAQSTPTINRGTSRQTISAGAANPFGRSSGYTEATATALTGISVTYTLAGTPSGTYLVAIEVPAA